MEKTYFFTLLDCNLQPIEDFAPDNGSEIESVRQQAISYMESHGMPCGTLTMDDPATLLPSLDSIDIIL